MKLREILDATTRIYRPGPAVASRQFGLIRTVDVWLQTPHETEAPMDDSTTALVDVHFFTVAVDRAAAEAHRDDLRELLAAWPPDGTYEAENRLASGPSYIELGAQAGTFMGQQDAMRMMALGEVLELWRVVTPRKLMPGISDQEADQLAGSGLVMISGYRR